MKKTRGTSFKFLAVAFPASALAIITPVVVDMPPFLIAPNVNVFQWLLVAPYYVGLAAAPGYVAALFGRPEGQAMSTTKRLWIRGSLSAAVLASIGGLSTASVMIPLPFVLGSLFCSILVWRDFKSDVEILARPPVR